MIIGVIVADKRIYENALSNIRLNPKEVWCIGDNLIWEVQEPQRIGIYSVWNDFEDKGLPHGSKIIPDKIINNISNIINNVT